MAQTLQVTKTLAIVPLVIIQSSDFRQWYRMGVWWCHHGREGQGPLEDTYFSTCFLGGIQRHAYTQPINRYLVRDVAFYLGMIHGGVLSATGTIRTDTTTLVHLHETESIRGYQAGREYFFVDADKKEEWYMTEDDLIKRLQELVNEYESYKDARAIVRFGIGCILGELSGHLFPWTREEHHAVQARSIELLGYVCPINPKSIAAQQFTLQVVS